MQENEKKSERAAVASPPYTSGLHTKEFFEKKENYKLWALNKYIIQQDIK